MEVWGVEGINNDQIRLTKGKSTKCLTPGLIDIL